jgi:hypothetical protein
MRQAATAGQQLRSGSVSRDTSLPRGSDWPGRPAPAQPALIQTAVPHIACPLAIRRAPGQIIGSDNRHL